MAGALIEDWGPRSPKNERAGAALARSRAVFHTPAVLGILHDTLDTHMVRDGVFIEDHLDPKGDRRRVFDRRRLVDLLISDEAERLRTLALELIHRRGKGTSARLAETDVSPPR